MSGVSKTNEGEGTWSKVQEKPGTSFQMGPLGVSHGHMLNSLGNPGILMGASHVRGPCVTDLSYSDSSPQPRAKIRYSSLSNIVKITVAQQGPRPQACKIILILQNIPGPQRLSPKSQPALEAGFYLAYTRFEQPRPAELTFFCTSCDQRKRYVSSNVSSKTVKE